MTNRRTRTQPELVSVYTVAQDLDQLLRAHDRLVSNPRLETLVIEAAQEIRRAPIDAAVTKEVRDRAARPTDHPTDQ